MRIGTFFVLFRNKIFTEFGGRGNQNFIVVVVPEKRNANETTNKQTNKNLFKALDYVNIWNNVCS